LGAVPRTKRFRGERVRRTSGVLMEFIYMTHANPTEIGYVLKGQMCRT